MTIKMCLKLLLGEKHDEQQRNLSVLAYDNVSLVSNRVSCSLYLQIQESNFSSAPVAVYQSTLNHIPQDLNLQHSSENPRPREGAKRYGGRLSNKFVRPKLQIVG